MWFLVIAPFVLMFLSVAFTALYYKLFHPGSFLQTNGPKFLPEVDNKALCICTTLFCFQMQDCRIPKIGYERVTTTPITTDQLNNGYHIEMREETFLNENDCHDNSNV